MLVQETAGFMLALENTYIATQQKWKWNPMNISDVVVFYFNQLPVITIAVMKYCILFWFAGQEYYFTGIARSEMQWYSWLGSGLVIWKAEDHIA